MNYKVISSEGYVLQLLRPANREILNPGQEVEVKVVNRDSNMSKMWDGVDVEIPVKEVAPVKNKGGRPRKV